MLQREKTGEMDVLRPGAKDWTWVDLPDVVVTPAKKGCDPLFGSWEAHGSGSTGLGAGDRVGWAAPREDSGQQGACHGMCHGMHGDFQPHSFSQSGAVPDKRQKEPIRTLASSLSVLLPRGFYAREMEQDQTEGAAQGSKLNFNVVVPGCSSSTRLFNNPPVTIQQGSRNITSRLQEYV